jgi:prolyl oligopeptidase
MPFRTSEAIPILVCTLQCVISASSCADDAPKQAGERFREIASAYWTDLLRTHPLEASVFVGDQRFSDRLDDPSVEAYQAWLDRLDSWRDALSDIAPDSLSAEERLDREILLTTIESRLQGQRFGDHLVPLAPIVRYARDLRFADLHLLFAQLGEFQPASTHGDVENYLLRLAAFPNLVDRIITTLKQGMAEGRLAPRVVMPRVVAQLRSLSKSRAEESPLWAFVPRLPTDWPDEGRSAAAARIRAAIENHVSPSYARLADFVESTYLPACPDRVGLGATADGAAHYAFLVRDYTTTDLTADQIHALGLAEMAKTLQAMDTVRKQVGFQGELKAFFAHVRTDARFKNRFEESILAGHRAILATMEANLPRLFGRLPRIPLEIRPFEPIRARSSPMGEYYPAAVDGSRPGIFYVNTSDPTSRPTYTMQALAYHEAIPGHHLQGALGLEAPGRPPFRRYFYFPAFDEGWALYCESLPAEIGLYTDPYAVFGQLNYDALRAARLVVDTGVHQKGWTRAQAIDYMEQNTSLPRNEIEGEVDRYIAWPGQALAYKVGELKIREIRAIAKKRAGASFDLRAFHDRLLSFGSVPLRLLEQLME